MAGGVLTERVTMTLEEFLALPEVDERGNHFELDEGELIILSPAGASHGRRVIKIGSYLDRVLDGAVFDVIGGEAGILMAFDPKPTVRGMDVAVLYRKDMPAKGMVRSAPLLIVEIVSPSNNPMDLDRKRKQYQQFGVAEIWFVYEDTKAVYVYRNHHPNFFICEWPSSFESSSLNLTIETRDVFR